VKGWKILFYVNGIKKQTKVAILISEKAEFKLKLEETKKVITYW
jgi:hypothetical protein